MLVRLLRPVWHNGVDDFCKRYYDGPLDRLGDRPAVGIRQSPPEPVAARGLIDGGSAPVTSPEAVPA